MANAASSRLGKRELGCHAFEDRMPAWLQTILENEDESNTLTGVIPKLEQLLERDDDIELAYLCTESVVQVHKLPNEGAHFCGYRNMQMICLALRQTGPDIAALKQELSVNRLQEMIEDAWDQGINSHGRDQTGGITATRKHVGTSEAEALLLSLQVACTGFQFKGKDAWSKVIDTIESYFSGGLSAHQAQQGVIQTSHSPIFLQMPRHSITVVGVARLRSGKRHLLAFDSAWRPPSFMQGEVAKEGKLKWNEQMAVRRYRKGERYLKRFEAFEMLTVHG